MKKEQSQRMGVSSSESKTGLALALSSPFVNMAGDVFSEVATVVPPPAVNTRRIVDL
jgi:hypothetical protein